MDGLKVIPATELLETEVQKKKVAAYARVSTDKKDQESSYEAQVSHFTKLIMNNPEWEFAGIYTDNGISGTSLKHRNQFLQMMEDCRARKIDIILTKSISRFARNTVDLLNSVRELKGLGIEVRFEKEQINTLGTGGEFLLTVTAAVAEQESVSISNNIKWAIRRKYMHGEPSGGTFVYGYRWVDRQYVIEPEEAAVIRQMYASLLRGESIYAIAKRLREDGRLTVRGKQFSAVTVRRILSNPLYVGDLLLQKVFVRDCITKKVINNIGQRDRYYVRNHHAAIVDRETYDKVQEVLAYRTKMGFMLHKGRTCFTHKIQCGICGKWYSRFSKDGYVDWICSTRRKGKDCPSKYLPDRRLKAACCRVLGLEEFDGAVFTDKVEKIVVPEQHRLVFHMKDGTIIDETWEPVSRKEYWTPERRAERSRQYKGRRSGA